jgi:hypothetical protein
MTDDIWFRHIISHWYDSDILVIGMIQTYYQSLDVWIIPMTDNMSESYQWLIICLNHTNDWWYVWIIPMTDALVWLRHIISHWYDSDILSVIGMIQVYYQSLIICLNHTNDCWYVWIIPITDNIPESHQSLIICLNHTNYW